MDVIIKVGTGEVGYLSSGRGPQAAGEVVRVLGGSWGRAGGGSGGWRSGWRRGGRWRRR